MSPSTITASPSTRLMGKRPPSISGLTPSMTTRRRPSSNGPGSAVGPGAGAGGLVRDLEVLERGINGLGLAFGLPFPAAAHHVLRAETHRQCHRQDDAAEQDAEGELEDLPAEAEVFQRHGDREH